MFALLLTLLAGSRELAFGNPPTGFQPSRCSVRFRVSVPPREDQRTIRVELVSEQYYRATDLPLDGAKAAKSHWVEWRALPDGRYALVATLYNQQARELATISHAFQVGQPD